jgi:hypothetical protein
MALNEIHHASQIHRHQILTEIGKCKKCPAVRIYGLANNIPEHQQTHVRKYYQPPALDYEMHRDHCNKRCLVMLNPYQTCVNYDVN